jgi:hypothetical protein
MLSHRESGRQVVQLNLSRTTTTISISSFVYSGTGTSTNASSSTEWGPGTLLGKILSRFGEALKDQIDNIVIRRRLNSLKYLFSREGSDETFPAEVYDDLLELSRYVHAIHEVRLNSEPSIGQPYMDHLSENKHYKSSYHKLVVDRRTI